MQDPPGPGHTVVSQEPLAWPPPASGPSVHDQQTVTSMPALGDTGTPAPPPQTAAPAPHQPWAGPFAPPAAAAPAPGPANPFAAPAAPAPHGEPVPPPPIAPDGPGQVPYGYPGGYGYPSAAHSGYGGAATAPGSYGWPGTAPPSNGIGTAGLVLGIIAAAGFCLWPLAILLGVLGVVFGVIGRNKAARGEATNPGQALAGIICGAVGLVLAVVLGAVVLATA
ncbi:DUF4190 domain-containing protein [Streptomyces sp. NPDC085946]|uniref:DUF4190 domain-containing protein n=1 Tax=Streptomyces sp. NPDC085946 TaxID=3365744 RepID=UPI0037CDE01B